MTRTLWSLAGVFAPLSLLMFGGANAMVPEFHREAVTVHRWMTDQQFATLFAISQVAPGSNVLVVSLIGWQVAGIAGLLVATVAINAPHCVLTYVIGRALERASGARWLRITKDAIVPVTIGLILASGVIMGRAADHSVLTVAISAGTAAFIVFTNRNPLWALGAGALAGLLGASIG